jgi:hypothetical protein
MDKISQGFDRMDSLFLELQKNSEEAYLYDDNPIPANFSSIIAKWKMTLGGLVKSDSSKIKSLTIYLQNAEHALLKLEAIKAHKKTNGSLYKDFVSRKRNMDDYRNIYLTDLIMEHAQTAIKTEIKTLSAIVGEFKGQVRTKIDSSAKATRNKIDSLARAANFKIDSVINLTNYGPVFVGPSFYVESMYGFSLSYILYNSSSPVRNGYAFSFEVLNSSYEDKRSWGFIGLVGILIGGKIIPSIGFSYLDGFGGSAFTYQVLFKNRSWMAGLSNSGRTGFGVKLLIGLPAGEKSQNSR